MPDKENHSMQMGLQLRPHYPGKHGNHFDTLLAVVRACEQAGLDSVFMADHFMFADEEHPEQEMPIMECFVTLGAIAAATSRIRIGQLVAGAPPPHPAPPAKKWAAPPPISPWRGHRGVGGGGRRPG